MDGNVNVPIWVVFEVTVQVVVKWSPKQKAKRRSFDNVCVHLKVDVTNSHGEVLGAPNCPACAAVGPFHLQLSLLVDDRSNVTCEVSSNDNDLQTLVEHARLHGSIVDEDVHFVQGKGEFRGLRGCYSMCRCWVVVD